MQVENEGYLTFVDEIITWEKYFIGYKFFPD
jgi:hypothetical protein